MPDPSTAITYTLPLTQFIQMFATPTPFAGGYGVMGEGGFTSETISYTFNFMNFLTSTAPYVSIAVGMVSGSVIQYYFSIRIAMSAVLFFFAFVMRRIGVPVPTEPVIVAGKQIGERVSIRRLPKIPRL